MSVSHLKGFEFWGWGVGGEQPNPLLDLQRRFNITLQHQQGILLLQVRCYHSHRHAPNPLLAGALLGTGAELGTGSTGKPHQQSTASPLPMGSPQSYPTSHGRQGGGKEGVTEIRLPAIWLLASAVSDGNSTCINLVSV